MARKKKDGYMPKSEVLLILQNYIRTIQMNDYSTDSGIPQLYKAMNYIDNAPTADVAEVRHGKWVIKSKIFQMLDDVDEELYVECPFCQRVFYVPFEFEDKKILEYARKHYPYCHCGARMDGEKKEEDI